MLHLREFTIFVKTYTVTRTFNLNKHVNIFVFLVCRVIPKNVVYPHSRALAYCSNLIIRICNERK